MSPVFGILGEVGAVGTLGVRAMGPHRADKCGVCDTSPDNDCSMDCLSVSVMLNTETFERPSFSAEYITTVLG